MGLALMRRLRRAGAVGGALAGYIVGIPLALPAIGEIFLASSVLPVAVSAWGFGVRFGLGVAVMIALGNVIVVDLIGAPHDVSLHVVPSLVLVLLAIITGRLRTRLDDGAALQRRLDGIIRAIPGLVFACDLTGRVSFMSGSRGPAGAAAALPDRVHPEDAATARDFVAELQVAGTAHRDMRFAAAGGQYHWMSTSAQLIRDKDGEPREIVGVATDVTERRLLEASLARQADFDALTGLPNLANLTRQIDGLLGASPAGPLAVAVLDVDDFGDVNDVFGHTAGDDVLRQIAARLRDMAAPGELCGRTAGHRFALVGPATNRGAARNACERLQRLFETAFLVGEHPVGLATTVGIAIAPEHGRSAETLLRHADIALGTAKRAQESCQIYEPELDRSAPTRLALLSELRTAVANSELVLHYQPIVNLAGRQAVHAEALMRWRSPRRGLVPPGEFIPIAEQSGLIKPMTDWLLAEALRQCWRWQETRRPIGVAVNISVRNLYDGQLASQVRRLLDRSGLDPGLLTLEVTESVVMSDHERSAKVLAQMRALGVRIAIDDFGTGQSSLAYLARLPVDTIKIDRSFVKGLFVDEPAAAIVRATIDLGHTLGLGVLAEGVEDERTLMALRSLGCDQAQGYHLSPPVPPAELERWLAAAAAHPPTTDAAASGQTILVVDDQDIVRMTAQLLLQRNGFEVVLAADANEALAVASSERRIGAAIIDAGIAEAGGPALHARLRRLRPELRALFTAGPLADVAEIPDCVRKPFTEQALVGAVRALFDVPSAAGAAS